MGDRVYFLKNDKNLGVKNGTLGTIEEINKKQFNVKLDGEEKAKVSFNIGQYDHIDHGYAGTVHKEQGVTVDKAYVLISKYFDRHLAYVAFTRHRDSLMVFSNQQDFKDRDAMYKTLSRERSKGMGVDFAQARWIEPSNKHELNLSKHAVSQQQLAKDRLAIKALKGKMPDRDFSFARALEQFKGTIQGIVRLSDDRQMLCIGKEDQSKLVAISHDFENHVGKKVSIQINNQGKILQCMVDGQGKMISSNEKQKENFVSERSQAQKLPQREIEIGLG